MPTAGVVAGAKLEGDFLVAVRDLQQRVAAGITPRQGGTIGFAIELDFPGFFRAPPFVGSAASRYPRPGGVSGRSIALPNGVRAGRLRPYRGRQPAARFLGACCSRNERQMEKEVA